jgi:hypothetical protein
MCVVAAPNHNLYAVGRKLDRQGDGNRNHSGKAVRDPECLGMGACTIENDPHQLTRRSPVSVRAIPLHRSEGD